MPGDLRAEVEALAIEWEDEAICRERSAGRTVGFAAQSLLAGASFERAHAKRLRDLLARASSPEPESVGPTPPRCEATPNPGSALRCDRPAGHDGNHSAWTRGEHGVYGHTNWEPAAPAPRPPAATCHCGHPETREGGHRYDGGPCVNELLRAPAPRPEETRPMDPYRCDKCGGALYFASPDGGLLHVDGACAASSQREDGGGRS